MKKIIITILILSIYKIGFSQIGSFAMKFGVNTIASSQKNIKTNDKQSSLFNLNFEINSNKYSSVIFKYSRSNNYDVLNYKFTSPRDESFLTYYNLDKHIYKKINVKTKFWRFSVLHAFNYNFNGKFYVKFSTGLGWAYQNYNFIKTEDTDSNWSVIEKKTTLSIRKNRISWYGSFKKSEIFLDNELTLGYDFSKRFGVTFNASFIYGLQDLNFRKMPIEILMLDGEDGFLYDDPQDNSSYRTVNLGFSIGLVVHIFKPTKNKEDEKH